MPALESPEIRLDISIENSTALLNVRGKRFSGTTDFPCDKETFAQFAAELEELYATLREGETRLCEWHEPDDNYVNFASDGMGHFEISGVFCKWERWTLNFSETIDQTYLKNFVNELRQCTSK